MRKKNLIKILPHSRSLIVVLGCAGLIGLFVSVYTYRITIATKLFEQYRIAYPLSYVGTNDAALNIKLGNYYFSHEYYQVARAQTHFERALVLDSSHPGAHYQLARIKFIRGDLIDAMVELEDELVVNPEMGKAHYMKGLTAGYLKNFELAEKEFLAFVSFDSFNWAGYNDLAWIQFAMGKYREAEETAKIGLSKTNNNPWLHNSVGVAQLAQGEKSEAHEHFLAAQKGFSEMTEEEWGGSYPGNDPRVLESGLAQTREAIEKNIELAQ